MAKPLALKYRLLLTLYCSTAMAITSAILAIVVSTRLMPGLTHGEIVWKMVFRFAFTSFVCEFPLWFIGAAYLPDQRLLPRLLWGLGLGVSNTLVAHGMVWFFTDLLHFASIGFTGFVWGGLWTRLSESLQFGMFWVGLVGWVTIPMGALFGALVGISLPTVARRQASGSAARDHLDAMEP